MTDVDKAQLEALGRVQEGANGMQGQEQAEGQKGQGQEVSRGVKTSEFWLGSACIMFILLAATVLVWFGKISSEQWVSVSTWVPGALVGVFTLGRSILKGLALFANKLQAAKPEAPK